MRGELYPYRIALFNASNASSSNQRAIGHRESLAEAERAPSAEEKASLTVEIRALDPSDYDALLALWKASGLPHRPLGRDGREAIVSQMRRDPGLFLGAFLGGRLAGSVIASFDGRKGWVKRLAVDPHERRQGIGKKLTEEAERALKARGSQIIAALVEADNFPSLLLFEKCGYIAHKGILYLTKRDSGQV